jgi:threonine aldolase
VAVFLVASGTAANALGLSAYARPGGVVFGHREAHILVDEAGAAEFFGGGVKLVAVDSVAGKITPAALADAMARFPEGFVHHGQPVAVSLTQVNEFGVAYRPAEIAVLAELAKTRNMAVHMDGARFAGAVARLGLSPAELTWRAGVDVLSFGGTKNGCLAAEAVIFFDTGHARDFGFARQRAGQGFSKNWFIAAQFDAYLRDGHWLDLASHANAMAERLAATIRTSGVARLAVEPDANEIFAILPAAVDARLKAAGAVYYPWPAASLDEGLVGEDDRLVRLVTSVRTGAEVVDRFAALLGPG